MSDKVETVKSPSAFSKWRNRAMIAGALLALICRVVPPDYRAVCDAIATICRGGL